MPKPARAPAEEPGESPIVAVGFVTFCVLLIGGMVNDWLYLLFGGKGYIAFIMVLLTPAVWLASGNALRGFRDKMGLYWLGLLALMVAGVPFSYWKSGSASQIISFVSRSYCFFFYAASFVTTWKRCRSLMIINLIVTVMVVISCLKFGTSGVSSDGRFQIPQSIFSGNSNDLALQLTLGITFFMFLFFLNGIWKQIVGLSGILICLMYMLKTGSRGCLVALMLMAVVVFLISKRKLGLIIMALPLLIIGLVTIPSSSARRLALLFQSSDAPVSNMNDVSAIASQLQRGDLMKKSVTLTLTHPVFGVGMNQFANSVLGEAAKKGKWAAALGTHNSYLQVSSECGIPALICYLGVIVLCFKRSYRIYKLSAGKPQYLQIEGLSLCLFAGFLVYAVATFFFHIAYSGLLPLLSGQIMTLDAVAYPMLLKPTEPPRAALA